MKRIPKPFTVEVKGGRRNGPVTWPNSQPDVQPNVSVPPPETPPVAVEPWRQARILPALEAEAPMPADETHQLLHDTVSVPEPELATLVANIRARTVRVKQRPIDRPPPPPDPLAIGIAVIKQVQRQAKQRDGLPREALRRGERWRHRLPAVIRKAKRRQLPDG